MTFLVEEKMQAFFSCFQGQWRVIELVSPALPEDC